MQKITKFDLLHTLQETVERHLELAIDRYQNLEEKTLLSPDEHGGWSVAQCLWHLNSYGDFYLPHLKNVIASRKSNNPYFKSGWLGNYFTKAMNPETGTRKMKAFKAHIPPANLDGHKVVATFIKQQEQLLQCLRQASDANLDTRMPISISKWIQLKTGDVLRFLIAHDERHIQQAERRFK